MPRIVQILLVWSLQKARSQISARHVKPRDCKGYGSTEGEENFHDVIWVCIEIEDPQDPQPQDCKNVCNLKLQMRIRSFTTKSTLLVTAGIQAKPRSGTGTGVLRFESNHT